MSNYIIDGAETPLSPVGAKLFGADAAGNVGWLMANGLTPSGGDDTALMQAYFDDCAANGVVAVLGPGQFDVRATAHGSIYFAVSIPSRLIIKGMGEGVTTIKLTASTHDAAGVNSGGHIFYMHSVSDVTVENISFDGNRSIFGPPLSPIDGVVGNIFRLDSCTRVTIRSCTMKSAVFHGVLGVSGCKDVKISNCYITDCGYRAVHFNASDGDDLVLSCSVSDCHTYMNGADVINLYNTGIFIALGKCECCNAIGNTVENEKHFGIVISGLIASNPRAQKTIIANNSVKGCKIGIAVTDAATNVIVSNNSISGGGTGGGAGAGTGRGIFLAAAKNTVVIGNTITRVSGSGIYLAQGGSEFCSGIIINGNLILDCDDAAIRATAHAHNKLNIFGNRIAYGGLTVSGSQSLGIYLEGGSGTANAIRSIIISNNEFDTCRGHAMLMGNISDGIISFNKINDCYESSSPRGKALWIRTVSDAVKIVGNIVRNDVVVNNQTQIDIDAGCTNISVIENDVESTATNKISAATGATGRAYGNIGTASIPAGFLTGSAAL